MDHRNDIDGLRAIAVLSVLLYHFGNPLVPGGYTGVDIFFVISGFVIARSIRADLIANRFSIAGFYYKRICRILPALAVTILLTSIAAYFLLLPPDMDHYMKSVAAAGAFLSNVYFWRSSGYFAPEAQTSPLLHSWSLAVEEQFYIIVPLLLMWIYKKGGQRWGLFLTPLMVGSFLLGIAGIFMAPTASYFLLPTRAWELLIGTILALAGPAEGALARGGVPAGGGVLAGRHRRLAAWPMGQIASILGLALILCGFLLLDEASPFPGWNALFPCIGAALLIVAGTGTSPLPWVNRLLASRPLVAIGLVSYSLYLVHWPIVAFFQYRLMRAPSIAEGILMLLASLLLAILFWFFIEQPVRKWGARHIGDKAARRSVLAAGAGLSVLLMLLGAAGVMTHGLPGRFPDYDARYKNASATGQAEWRGPACFNETPSQPVKWDAAACTLSQGDKENILLWGDSFAAHYAPGILQLAGQSGARVQLYSFAGCPPIFAYYSSARIGCSVSNQRVQNIVRAQQISHVVMAARWDETPLRTLKRLGETIAALKAMGVRVTVIGQSPQFPADVQSLDYLSGQKDKTGNVGWSPVHDQRITNMVRDEAIAASASFIDPMAFLCRDGRCAYRDGSIWYYADYGHFSTAGSLRAVAAYFPLPGKLSAMPD